MADLPSIEKMLVDLIGEMRSDLSDESVEFASLYSSNREYDLALETIAFEAVAFIKPWNQDLFAKIAEGIQSSKDHYFKEALKQRRSVGLDS